MTDRLHGCCTASEIVITPKYSSALAVTSITYFRCAWVELGQTNGGLRSYLGPIHFFGLFASCARFYFILGWVVQKWSRTVLVLLLFKRLQLQRATDVYYN